jgi:hypothetical protein
MANDNASRHFRHKACPLTAVPTHKFPIGAYVIHKFGARLEVGSFRVMRHLPDGGAGLQYRMKSDRDGHERIAVESALERAAQEDLTP